MFQCHPTYKKIYIRPTCPFVYIYIHIYVYIYIYIFNNFFYIYIYIYIYVKISYIQKSGFSRSFPRSWLITGFVTRLTRRVSLVEQELLTIPEHPSSPRVTRSLILYVCFVDRCFVLLAIVLSVLRYTDSDYPGELFYYTIKLPKFQKCVFYP
jgi:hypothetical protein